VARRVFAVVQAEEVPLPAHVRRIYVMSSSRAHSRTER
jgi:hypothetical protein